MKLELKDEYLGYSLFAQVLYLLAPPNSINYLEAYIWNKIYTGRET